MERLLYIKHYYQHKRFLRIRVRPKLVLQDEQVSW